MRTLATSINTSNMDTLYAFTHGIDVDQHFAAEEVQVQKAWAQELTAKGYLTDEENQGLQKALTAAGELMLLGSFPWRLDDEDIHMNIERFLVERVQETGKKLHLGRSRNDLVATSLRLRVSRFASSATCNVKSVIIVLAKLAADNIDIIIPGMTHLQNGQPIRISQVFSSYGYRFLGDLRRFRMVKDTCLEAMPLGSAAFAGTTLAIDRSALAAELGFEAPCSNSYDGVGDRDFIIEALHAMSMVAVHMTKICEDLIYWSSTNVGLVLLPKNWSTGSSIMPNKRNPDVLELIRARASRIMAAEQEGKGILSGFGSSYGSDLHELKKTFFRIEKEFNDCTEILAYFLSEMKLDAEVANAMCFKGHILATDLANKLVADGVPFRDAYRKAADEVANGTANNYQVCEGEMFQQLSPGYGIEQSVEERNAEGGTAKERVLESLGRLKTRLAMF